MPNSKWNPKQGDYKKTNASYDKKQLNKKIKIQNGIIIFLVTIIFLLLIFAVFAF